MPSSDYYLPRASQAPTLSPAAVQAYQEAGWQVSPGGRVTLGGAVGPCGRCRQPTVRYGPHAVSTLCPDCREAPMIRALSVAAFLICAVAANVLTARYGLIPVGFGLTATAGTWAAGLVLLARDLVHDVAGRLAVLGCIAAGAALSALLATPQLAAASGIAFAVSELADFAVYQPMRRRGWARAVVASNLVGSAVDTLLFLWLAVFPIWAAMPGQMLAKTTATLVVVAPVVVARAVLRNRIRPQSV